jgi:hypothetical protein
MIAADPETPGQSPEKSLQASTEFILPATKSLKSIAHPEIIESLLFEPDLTRISLNFYTFVTFSSLKYIRIPSAVTVIPGFCFCKAIPGTTDRFCPLKSVTFDTPSKLRAIEPSAFAGCRSLHTIYLPEPLSKIDGESFLGSALHDVTIESGNRHFCVMDGYLMDKELTLIILYFGSAQHLQIPDQVQRIGRCSFENCQDIVSIACGPTSELLQIKERAFAMCTFLKSVNLPPSVKELEAGCFTGCKKLEVVTFATKSELEIIGEQVFSGCRSLPSLGLPSSLVSVGMNCFSGCNSLSRLGFDAPSHLRELNDLPPVWNEDLNNIPDSVEVLHLPRKVQSRSGYVVGFGAKSKLQQCDRPSSRGGMIRMFLQLSSRPLKALRSSLEFH